MYFWCFGFRGELGFLNCDDVCMCVVNKQFELLEFVSESVYVDLQYDEIYLTFTAGRVCLCGVSSPVVVLGLFVRLSLLLLFAMIRSVVKSFKVPGVEVVASRMSNEAALTRMIDDTKKTWSYLTLVLDG